MPYLLACAAVFGVTYLFTLTFVTVFYHRGLTHGAVRMGPKTMRFILRYGNWVTGVDPKAWSCMHRMHHLHSDRPEDPRSPVNHGVRGVLKAQYESYGKTLEGLSNGDEKYSRIVPDLDFSVNWLNEKGLWYLPHVAQIAVSIALGVFFGAWLMGLAFFLGMISHPIQGWMVNSLGHRFGYRNFATDDNSKNNTLVGWFVLGEGYQNNHHESPSSANFAVKWWEFDGGHLICRVLRAFGVVQFEKFRGKPSSA